MLPDDTLRQLWPGVLLLHAVNERASARQYTLWHGFTLVAFISTVASSVTAALMKQEFFARYGQLVLVVLPLIGAAASAILSQFRFRELEDLRERGRIEMEDILFCAQGLLAAATDEAACQRAYEEIRRRVKALIAANTAPTRNYEQGQLGSRPRRAQYE